MQSSLMSRSGSLGVQPRSHRRALAPAFQPQPCNVPSPCPCAPSTSGRPGTSHLGRDLVISNNASPGTWSGQGLPNSNAIKSWSGTKSLSQGFGASDGQNPDNLATVNFHLKYKTSFGQAVKLIGSHAKLGSWKITNAVELRWSAGDVWEANIDLPAGGVYEYKYVLIDYETKQALEWQSGNNSVLAVVASETVVDVFDNWGNTPGSMVAVDEAHLTREDKLQIWASEMTGYWREARRLQIELAQKNVETQALRSELAALRMELSLERQARMERDSAFTELQVENARLRAQLTQKTVELNNTLTEVLQMLHPEDEDDEHLGGGLLTDGTEDEEEQHNGHHDHQHHAGGYSPFGNANSSSNGSSNGASAYVSSGVGSSNGSFNGWGGWQGGR